MPDRIKTTRGNAGRGEGSPWIRVMRLRFVPASLLPALLGSAVAWNMTGGFHLSRFFLVLFGLSLNHVGLNMIDDVFDFLHAADRPPSEGKNPYTGGSGVLAESLLSHSAVLAAAFTCFAATAVIALCLTVAAGWPVLLLAGIGIFSSIFYAVPPVRYGYRGLGELAHVINFGPVIVLGAFYVQTGAFTLEPLAVSFVPGFLMGAMIVANEIPDAGDDRRAGKNTLVVRFGEKWAVSLYGAGLAAAYGLLLLSVVFRAVSPGALLGFAGAPLAFQSWKMLQTAYDDPLRVVPVNRAILQVHRVSCMGLVTGYLIAGAF
jgi:1,4-dihydroxy-2-naphthoate octaprenyltransferase